MLMYEYFSLPIFYGESFILGETFDLGGGRGLYMTHILTSAEVRATTTAHDAFETVRSGVVEVRARRTSRQFKGKRQGKPEGYCRCFAKLTPQKEVVVVTHRRFVDNVLQRCTE